MRDPYEVLDLSPDATDADIKKAFREKAKQYHPDRHPGNERVAEVFKDINAAYQLLNSKNRARTDFDRRRQAASQSGTRSGAGASSASGAGARAKQDAGAHHAHARTGEERAAGMGGGHFHEYYEEAAKRAEDKAPGSGTEGDEEEDLYRSNFADHDFAAKEERAAGADTVYGGDSGSWFRDGRKIHQEEAPDDPDDHDSSGGFTDFLSRVTDRGKGIFGSRGSDEHAKAGSRKGEARGADVQYSLSIPFMDAALGARHRLTIPLETGSGKTLDVNIPAGVRDGQQIRLKGQGMPGPEPGDALIDISVDDHEHFMRDGLDLFIDIPVTLDEAMLGSDIKVPTIHGPVTVKVPPGSDSGQTLRLRGKGIVRNDRKGKAIAGDQYLTLTVKMPPAPGPLLRRAVEEEARNSPYGVRQALKDLL